MTAIEKEEESQKLSLRESWKQNKKQRQREAGGVGEKFGIFPILWCLNNSCE